MSKQTTKQERINQLIKEIRKSKTRNSVLSKYVKMWQLSDRSFDRLWRIANEQVSELQQKAKDAADKVYIEETEKAAKEAVMSKIERQEVLSKIARGTIQLQKPFNVGGMLENITVVPDYMDRRNAIAELNKMDGDYAPLKTDITTKIIPPELDYSKLTSDELITLKNLSAKCSMT